MESSRGRPGHGGPSPLRGRGESPMTRRTVRSVLAGAALVAALNLASPAQAHAASWNRPDTLWSWLSDFFGSPAVAFQRETGGRHAQSSRTRPTFEKQGVAIDPNGSPDHQTSGAGVPVCHSWNSQGVCTG